jgi:hypothetical protein
MTKTIMRFLTIVISCLIVAGCSKDIPIAASFSLPKGSEITLQSTLSNSYPDKELIFTLVDIPESKKERDFSDYIGVTFSDASGKTYNPEKIWDINGGRRDIVAVCNNIPKGTIITAVKIVAFKDLKGTGIRWWNGNLL